MKHGKFWSILLGHFIKHKRLISEECTLVDVTNRQSTNPPGRYPYRYPWTLGIYQLLEKRSARSWPFDMRNDKSKCRHNWLLQRTIKTGDDETAGRPWWWAASRWFLSKSTVLQPPEPDGRTKLNLELVFLRLNLIIYEMTFSFLLQVS